MGYLGKIIGGIAGFAVGGPVGAVFGAAMGHAADQGFTRLPGLVQRATYLPGRREQVFAVSVVVLAAKLAKVDGPVVRAEIDAFKTHFRIPPESMREIGRLFDQARDSPDGYQNYARQLGASFADNRALLEDIMAALFAIARADGPVNAREADCLGHIHRAFGLDQPAWDRARSNTPRGASTEPDPYAELGLTADASTAEIHRVWRDLMRENHPDTLAARGVPEEFARRAHDRVARINAAWDRIKRERKI